ncbi:MAG: hypothetical protein Q7Q71_00195, partial [Verrucomicrobiota bacterium JB023]|nr:hypothetical protein [Verrucomicrobiota bacterium JB023]
MAKCAYCNTGILFGGINDGAQRYCNDTCHAAGYFVSLADQIPVDTLNDMAVATKGGACPKCQKTGSPVDVYKAHRIWSALILSSWSSHPEISCKKCAVKRQIGAV